MLWLALAAQAALLCWRLDLLDLWTDELFTLQTVALPVPEILRRVAADIHPPLYYLLQHFWVKLPLPLTPIVQMRLLSVIFSLAATAVVYKLWAARLSPRGRMWFLGLWTLSPCLLLYSRMARSYSLQLLVVAVAAWWGLRLAKEPSRRCLLFFSLATAAAFYTHYVPGMAVAAVGGLVLLSRRRWREALLSGALVAALYLPWAWTLAESLGKWARMGATYTLTGGTVTELGLKSAFAGVSFLVGETLPTWLLPAGLLLILPCLWLLWAGLLGERELALPVAAMAAIGFFGVARWVSYPFVPARLLWVLPFLLLLLVAGAERRRRGNLVLAGLAVLSIAGAAGYFGRRDFLNKGYAIPFRDIALGIQAGPPPSESIVLCDRHNTDYVVVQHYLGPARRLELIGDEGTPELAWRLAADPRLQSVWLVRNTHDISPGRVNSRAAGILRSRLHADRRGYLPLSPVERALARALGVTDPPDSFYEVIEFRR